MTTENENENTSTADAQLRTARAIYGALADIEQLTNSHGLLANQFYELANVQLQLAADTQNTQRNVQEFIQTALETFELFERRLRIVEEALGIDQTADTDSTA